MERKGYVCTSCGNKKKKLTPALQFGFYKRRQQFEEQRYIEGVSDICKICDAFTFFLNLDDNSSDTPDVMLTSGSIKYKTVDRRYKSGSSQSDSMESRHSSRSRSCVRMVSSDRSSRRSQSTGGRDSNWSRVQEEPIYGEMSPSSDSDYGRHGNLNIVDSLEHAHLVYEYSDYDSSTYDAEEETAYCIDVDIDDDYMDYETDDEDIPVYRRTETRSSQTLESMTNSLPTSEREESDDRRIDYSESKKSSKKQKKKSKDDLPKKVKQTKELLSKLNGMRERLNSEYERTQSELKQLEYDNIVKKQELKKKKRERGGAHYILCEMSDSYSEREEQVKSKNVTREKDVMRFMKEEKLPRSTPYMELDLTPVCSSFTSGSSTTATEGPTSSRQSLTPLSTPSRPMPKASRGGLKSFNKFPRVCYTLSNVQRAIYQGFAADPRTKINKKNQLALRNGEKPVYTDDPPFAQFTTIPCDQKEINYLLGIKPQASDMRSAAQELLVSRAPVFCPDYDCRRITFIADFNRHLMYDHRTLTMERTKVRQSKTFFLDYNVTLLNKPKCHILYLVREKIIDTHSQKLRELLPVLVMTARVRLCDVFGISSATELRGVPRQALAVEMFVIWLTSFIPKGHDVRGTICVWSTHQSQLVDSLYVHTSDVYDIREPQDLPTICSRSNALIIPCHIVDRMTDNGLNFLAIQVQVY